MLSFFRAKSRCSAVKYKRSLKVNDILEKESIPVDGLFCYFYILTSISINFTVKTYIDLITVG